ncbi:MAG: hypothetical protein R3B06_14140 [Kofleriaceae bacterium]
MKRVSILVAASFSSVLAWIGSAAAEEAARPPGLTLPAGKLNVMVNLEVEMSADRVAKPLALSPDVAYGVTPDLTVALVHSKFGLTGFRAAAGGGLCVTGTDGGCARVYNNVGGEAWYNVARGQLAAAVGGGVHATSFEAGFVDAKLGARLRWTAGKVALSASPSVELALTKRDDGAGNRLNKDRLWLPVLAMYKATPALQVGAGTGLKAPLTGFADAYQIPLGVTATYAFDPATSVGAAWVFGAVVGGATNPPAPAPGVKGLDVRGLQVWGSRTF